MTTPTPNLDTLKKLGKGFFPAVGNPTIPAGKTTLWDSMVKNKATTIPIVATSSASRIDTGLNGAKLDAKIADKEAAVANQEVVDASKKEASATNPNQETIYVDQNFADTHDMNNEAFKNYKVGTKDAKPAEILSPEQQQIKDQQVKLDKDAADAKAFYDDFKLRQEATTAALIDSITKKYEARRASMQDTNARMLEGKRIAGISAGRQRYAPGMEQGLLSTEEMDGQSRLAEIDAQELQLIAQAKQARDDASYKAFNSYMEQLDKNNADKMETITKLHQFAIDADKAIADKKKADKEAVLDQTRMADSVAPAALQAYQGLKTPEEKAAFIQKLAEKYSLPAEMIQSSMLTYGDENAKADLEQTMKSEQIKTEKAQQANYYSQITDRTNNPGGKAKEEKPLTQAETMLESGAKTSDGTVFNGRGADGFVDPYLYIQIYNGWDTEAEKVAFLKKFPPADNINPEFPAEELPQAIKIRLQL